MNDEGGSAKRRPVEVVDDGVWLVPAAPEHDLATASAAADQLLRAVWTAGQTTA